MILILLLIIILPSILSYSTLDCQSYPPWPVDRENINSTEIFQRWIQAWQNSCNSKSINTQAIIHNNGGLGHTLAQVAGNMVKLIELNQIFRPVELWIWAENDSNRCTGHRATLDCYFLPISTCGPFFSNYSYSLNGMNISKDLQFSIEPIDICKMAKYSRKSLQWVCGQFLLYVLRYREDIKTAINEILRPIYDVIYSNPQNAYISVHVRGGHAELDAGRRANVSFSEYITLVDKVAYEIELTGKKVQYVFVACHMDELIGDATQLQKEFPRPWKYLTVNHTKVSQEPEFFIKNNTLSNVNKSQLVLEFLTDIELLMHGDAFIGSGSNIYFIISNIRAALQIGRRNHTCMIHSVINYPNRVMCETDQTMKDMWISISGRGFKGGTPFAE